MEGKKARGKPARPKEGPIKPEMMLGSVRRRTAVREKIRVSAPSACSAARTSGNDDLHFLARGLDPGRSAGS